MNWEYCECGCHGHELQVAGRYFWLFNDLKGTYRLHSGHGWTSAVIGTYTSWEEAEVKVKEILTASLNELKIALKPKRKSKKS